MPSKNNKALREAKHRYYIKNKETIINNATINKRKRLLKKLRERVEILEFLCEYNIDNLY